MILHVDMDAFYASVEVRDRPELAKRPVIVGGTVEGRGVVAAANYVARRFGVHSAMPCATAKRLCPHAIFLPSRIDYYGQVSGKIREIFCRFTPIVEPLSLDEAFLDVTGSRKLFGAAVDIGRKIKQVIGEEIRLVASVGVAPNKSLAKIASDLEKPNGFVVVQPNNIEAFLEPLPVERIWGIGRQGSQVFHRMGIRTIGQLRQVPLDWLENHFGNNAQHFWQLARGIDDRAVVPDREAKSISHETTFATDLKDRDVLRAWLLELTVQVARRLRRIQRRGRTIQIKVRFADFRTMTRSKKLALPTNSTDELFAAASDVFHASLPETHPAIRLLGVGMSDLDRTGLTQRQLFDQPQREKQSRLDTVTDQLKDRFGSGALKRASSLANLLPGKRDGGRGPSPD